MSIEKIKPASDSKLPKALYRGSLPIGGVELDCFVLDDEKNTRVLLQSGVFAAFKRPRRGRRERDPVYDGIQLPSFIGGNNLLPFINQEIVDGIQEIKFEDKGVVRTGYRDVALPRLCKLYIDARHVLTTRQQPLADMANGKKYKKHQYLTDDVGKSQLRLQIRKTLGLMEVAPNMRWFQNKSMKQGQLSLFPDIDE